MVIKSVQYIILVFAFGITFLHSVTPHSHHSAMSINEDSAQHSESSDLIEMLGLLFHSDAGDHNLENTLQTDCVVEISNSSYLILFAYFTNSAISIEKTTLENFYHPSSYVGFDISSYSHRGPPLV
jgi:hypothetical protein